MKEYSREKSKFKRIAHVIYFQVIDVRLLFILSISFLSPVPSSQTLVSLVIQFLLQLPRGLFQLSGSSKKKICNFHG